MDPEQFNAFGSLSPFDQNSLSQLDNLNSDQLSLNAIDSSGNYTMPNLGIGPGSLIQGASSLLGAYGYEVQGQEEQGAYDYNAKLALQQGQFELQDIGDAETDTLSTQRAAYAKSGVEMSGSPLDTAVNTAYQFEMDKQIANYNAQSKANMDTYEGQVAAYNANFKAGMSVFSGIADLALGAGMIFGL